MAVSYYLPIKLVSEMNNRDCWQAKYRRARFQKMTAKIITASEFKWDGSPIAITIIREIGPRGKFFDSDNDQASKKATRDGITLGLGLTNDNDNRLTWEYKQKKSNQHRVRVEINYTNTEDDNGEE